MLTRKEVAEGLGKVERAAEEFFEIDGAWPQGETGDAVEEWMVDQIRKCSWTNMLDETTVEMAEDSGAVHAVKAARRFL